MKFRTEILPLKKKAAEYLTSRRKLDLDICREYGVASSGSGEIVIQFFDENSELQLLKFRSSDGSMLERRRYDDDGNVEIYECKTYCEPGGKPVLLGSNIAQDFTKPLYICYGDYDAITLAAYLKRFNGHSNAVSMPFGDRALSWIDKQWDYLEKFPTIIFCPDVDHDEKTKSHLTKKLYEMSARLGKYRCKMIPESAMMDCKDINDLFYVHSNLGLSTALEGVIDVPEPGLIRLVDYVATELTEGTPIGMGDIDAATGGLGDGQYVFLSGDNNAGKTTLALNFVKEFTKAREKTFYWTGEQRPDRIRWWYEQIVAGPNFVDNRVSQRTGRVYHYARPELVQKIRDWYADYFFIYDRRSIDAQNFFEVAELAVRRHGIKKFIIDNLMAFTGGAENYLQAQGDFAESCKAFAEEWNACCILLTHNKKTDNKIPQKDDVEGSKKITNWADIGFQLKRVFPNEKKDFNNADSILSLCKNREAEILEDVRLLFDSSSKRLVQMIEPQKLEQYCGWEDDESEIEEYVLKEESMLDF